MLITHYTLHAKAVVEGVALRSLLVCQVRPFQPAGAYRQRRLRMRGQPSPGGWIPFMHPTHDLIGLSAAPVLAENIVNSSLMSLEQGSFGHHLFHRARVRARGG